MTVARLTCACALLLASGCKEDPAPPAPATLDAGLVAESPPTPNAVDAGHVDAGPPRPKVERPVPKDVAVVRMDMSEEIQMKAITYMSAMRAPLDGDPAADPDYAEELRKKLDTLSRAMDRGSDKATMNKSAVMSGGRQIDLLMSDGCQPETPKKLLTQRAGIQLSTAYSHGVLVVRCNDKSLQCLQSTRDPDDVLCTSAPRKNKPGGLPGKPAGAK